MVLSGGVCARACVCVYVVCVVFAFLCACASVANKYNVINGHLKTDILFNYVMENLSYTTSLFNRHMLKVNHGINYYLIQHLYKTVLIVK